jgi:hypothetical protein
MGKALVRAELGQSRTKGSGQKGRGSQKGKWEFREKEAGAEMERQRTGQRIFLILAVGICLAVCICYNWKPRQQGRNFTFQKVETQEAIEQTAGTSWVYGPGMVDLETDAQFRFLKSPEDILFPAP